MRNPSSPLQLTFFLLLASAHLLAQATATIHGTVLDSSGAVVPEADVKATNVQTSLTRSVRTDSSGNYTVALLPIGEYQVQVDRAGFAGFIQKGIRLQVNTDVEVIATLKPGATAESVQVTADAALVQTTTTALVQVIDEKRVTELPLNGRNVLQLLSLSAGISDRGSSGGTLQVNTLGGSQYQNPVSINGSRGNATNFLLDGADNNDLYTNISEAYPNPDAVQEFSVQSSTFDAQYGRGVGGVVNVITRSGTNDVHGTAFEFLRNYKLNAANFFSGRDTLKRNQFGVTLGGPVYIPGLYDGRNKAFLFGSYQGTRSRTATPGALRNTPSEAMKRGDFSGFLGADGSGRIRDPLTPGEYFPNNQIPQSRFDPVARQLLNYMPSSSASNYQLRFGTPVARNDDDQMLLRADYLINSANRLTARYFLITVDRPWVTVPNNLYFVNAGQQGHNQSITATHSWTSSRLLNELSFTFHGSTPNSTPPAELPTYESLGSRIRTVPGFPTMVLDIANWSGVDLGLGYYNGQRMYQAADNVSWVTGKQNLRFGGDYKNHLLDKSSFFLTGGTATFSGQLLSDPGRTNAGHSFAEFLLGVPTTWRQQSYWSEFLYTNYFALYIQDDIRLTQNLTLNLGLRWDPKFDSYETGRKRMTFEPGRQSTRFPNAPPGLLFQGDAGYEDRIIPTDWNNLAPRVGFAWQVAPRTVLRSAYGIFYDQFMGIFNNRSAQAAPFIRQTILQAPGSLSNPYAGSEPLDPSPVNPDPNFVFSPYSTWALPTKDMVAGYMQNWNFIVERQFFSDVLLRLGYVGSRGVHLLNAIETNPALYGPGATAANVNQRRPYQPLGGLQLGNSDAWSSYHSMQFTAQKRYSKGATITANYTWSKSIDITSYASVEGNAAGPDPFNTNNNRGVSDFDVPHRLVVSGVWELPALKDTPWLVRGLLGGWQQNFIFTAQSGSPFTVLSGVDNALMGIGGNFADVTGVDWRLDTDRSKAEKIDSWFNRAAFRTNAVGTIGTGRRNQLRGPGNWNVDFGLFKN
ncbi:MAG TPA: TonB-dependent receptor, partial [Bryobacteraceae bacterium]|nr:TonB-dependent receptor [Bryobacteraceae bacterium]